MKKVILILTAVLLSAGVFAQAASDKKAAPAQTAPAKKAMHYVYMGGKMSACYGETYEPMAADMKLHDGMMVSTKGEVTMKDGKKMQMKDGECVDMNGKIMDHKMAHAKDMKKDEKKADEKKKM
jgi:hypothetical protein